jgi:predicted O-methyltransferase YrrM
MPLSLSGLSQQQVVRMANRTLDLTDRLYDYVLRVSVREPAILAELRAETAQLPGAGMQIGPEQGQFMALLVELIGARRTIEIGTFTGYSALAVALALPPDGKLIACDISEEYTRVARRYWAKAGVEHKIELRLGPAVDTLGTLASSAGSFDFAFIDADKTSYDRYYEAVLQLLRPGGLVAIDNVLWGGAVADPKAQDEDTAAIRAFNDKLKGDNRVSLSLVPIGDGLTLARKRG